ncbi:hypothetical protein EV714DRAFT_274351 [Schizophyllum commune]
MSLLNDRIVDEVDHEVALRLDCEPVLRSTLLIPTWEALRSQVTPSEGEICKINSAITNERCTFERYVDIIAQTQQSLDALRSACDEVDRSIALKTSLVSPVRRLPTEVLAIIITDVLRDDSCDDISERMVSSVMHVCHRWREIALSLPVVWTDISFSYYSEGNRCALLEECLRRTQGKPLSITLSTMTGDVPADEAFTQVLLASATRWQKLTLDNISLPWLSTDTLHAPALEHLEIMNSHPTGWLCFANCPALVSVTLDIPGFRELDLPWGQLTSLDIDWAHMASIDACLEAIQGCDRLLTFALSSSAGSYPLDDLPDVVLPALTELTLARCASTLLPLFHVPRLTSLGIGGIGGYTVLQFLETYAARSEGDCLAVTSLSLYALRTEPDWVRLFELYANITELHVYSLDDSVGPILLPLWLALRHRQDLLPHLAFLDLPTLNITSLQDVQLVEDIVDDRVLRRPAGVARLARLSFSQIDPQYVRRVYKSTKMLECRACWPVGFPTPDDEDPSNEDAHDAHAEDGDALDDTVFSDDEVCDCVCRKCAQGSKGLESEEALIPEFDSDDVQSPVASETDDPLAVQGMDLDEEAFELVADYAMCSSDDGSVAEEWIEQELLID